MRRTNRVKLKHDAAQIRHLHRQGILDSDYLQIAQAYEDLAAGFRHLPHDTTIAALDDTALAATQFAYNRLIHLPETGRVAGDALSIETDFSSIDAQYADTHPAPVVIDNVLSPDALFKLQRLCRDATIWFEVKDHGGHLGAYFEEGLGCDLLVQISEALRRRLPRSLSHLSLAQLWAYKHVQGGSGTDYHADIGQVSANLWITADDASLDKDGGGLEIWPVEMPAGWDFHKANVDRAGIRSLLAKSPVRPVNIPHRCNRLVLFDANLFHRTSPGRFAQGYRSNGSTSRSSTIIPRGNDLLDRYCQPALPNQPTGMLGLTVCELCVDNTIVKSHRPRPPLAQDAESGNYAIVRDLAKAINESYLGRVLRITLLSTTVIEAILEGRQPTTFELDDFLRQFPIE